MFALALRDIAELIVICVIFGVQLMMGEEYCTSPLFELVHGAAALG